MISEKKNENRFPKKINVKRDDAKGKFDTLESNNVIRF